MSRLDLVVGPNGAGKSTFVELVLVPTLPPGTAFVNADEIAKVRWAGAEQEHSYQAAQAAARTRDRLIRAGHPLIAETVFSHPSKLELVDRALLAGYRVQLHVLAVPAPLALARVRYRVAAGGHSVPPHKVLERYERLWPLVAEAIARVDGADVWDTSRAGPPTRIAAFVGGLLVGLPTWPAWTPLDLQRLGGPADSRPASG